MSSKTQTNKTGIWDIVPKGRRRSQPDPKIFKTFKWDIEGEEGGGPDGDVPNAAHKILFKRRLITNILINVVARYLFCGCCAFVWSLSKNSDSNLSL